MKMLYSVLALVLTVFVFVNPGLAQYTATHTGNWSSALTWAPGVKPSANCTNCTITINANVTVTLDAAVTFNGSTIMTIGSDASSPAKLVINSSGGSSFATGFNIIMVSAGSSGAPPGIKLLNANTKIDATSAGEWDGIFNSSSSGGATIYDKLIGNPPAFFLQIGTTVLAFPGTPTVYGQFLKGPTTLSSSGGPLPIILSDFEAILNKNEVNLTWTSEVEVNSDHYSIERSGDGSRWGSIGTVAAKGFSDISVNYSFTDISPFSGINYYRLQMVDRDGKYGYSNVKVVRRFMSGLSVFPNPARDLVSISLGSDAASNLTVRLINQNGQLLQEQKLSNAAGTTVSFGVGSYAQGNYLLEIIDNKGNIKTSKFIISRP